MNKIFESFADGSNPTDWLDTGAFNSMAEDDVLFDVADLSGDRVLRNQLDLIKHPFPLCW